MSTDPLGIRLTPAELIVPVLALDCYPERREAMGLDRRVVYLQVIPASMRTAQLLILLGVIIALPRTTAADPPSEADHFSPSSPIQHNVPEIAERHRALKPGWLAYH